MNDGNYLPDLSTGDRVNKFIDGRNIYEGYQRGWGLMYGDLKEKVRNDSLYSDALAIVRDICILDETKLMNIFLILKFYLKNIEKGNIIEFGSYKGGTAIFMAYVVKQLKLDIQVHGLDTFEGMPQTNSNLDLHNIGDFKEAIYEETLQLRDKLNLYNLNFHKGLFQDNAVNVLNIANKISLAHIDCDIYESVAYSYNVVKKYMVKNGYILFDDVNAPSCIGAMQAYEELVCHRDKKFSEQVYPQYVIRA